MIRNTIESAGGRRFLLALLTNLLVFLLVVLLTAQAMEKCCLKMKTAYIK
jgi:hypothetical protein